LIAPLVVRGGDVRAARRAPRRNEGSVPKQNSRREPKRQRQQGTQDQRPPGQRQAHRRKRVGRAWLCLAAAGVLLVSAYWAYGRLTEPVTWRSVPILPSPHIALGEPHPPYNSDPPTSGPHTGGLARWGVHTEPIPKEMQLHNLEDGGVAINYSCTDCPELVEQLKVVAERYKQVVMAPYPGLDRKIALTAWGKIDTFDEFDERRIVRFIDAHIGIDHHGRR
jgi:hypothetical protein